MRADATTTAEIAAGGARGKFNCHPGLLPPLDDESAHTRTALASASYPFGRPLDIINLGHWRRPRQAPLLRRSVAAPSAVVI
jgi:hypothetical protein